jgi:hypothetical protein
MLRPYISYRGGRRRHQTQRPPRRTRANRLDQLRKEGTANTADLGVRFTLERVERERHADRGAISEEQTLALGQRELREIRAARSLRHSGELAVAREQRADARVAQRIAVASWCGRRRDGR